MVICPLSLISLPAVVEPNFFDGICCNALAAHSSQHHVLATPAQDLALHDHSPGLMSH